MSLNRCPQNGTPHPPHPIRLYFSGMGAVVPTTCPGEPEQICTDHDRPRPCSECA